MLLTAVVAATIAGADERAMEFAGVNDNPHALATVPEVLAECDRVIASGARWVRITPYWSEIERSADNSFDTGMLARIDAAVGRFQARGVEISMVLGHTPRWATSMPGATYRRWRPSQWRWWEEYVAQMTSRYQGKVCAWEIWNEPDHVGFWMDTLENYAELLRRAYPIIKASDPANVVLMAGIAGSDGIGGETWGTGGFFDRFLGLPGIGAYFDIINYHCYGAPRRHKAIYDSFSAIIASHGFSDRPIWITETGYSTDGAVALEPRKADMVDQLWQFYASRRIDRIFYYCFRNPPAASTSAHEAHFGLVDENLNPLGAVRHFTGLNGAVLDPSLEAAYPGLSEIWRNVYRLMDTSAGESPPRSWFVLPGGPWPEHPSRYAYYRVDDSFAYRTSESFYLDVTFRDEGTGVFSAQYQATDGLYRSLSLERAGSGEWRTHRFVLTAARFANGQNNKADLRIHSGERDLELTAVVLTRASGGASLPLWPLALSAGDGSHGFFVSAAPAGGAIDLGVNDGWISGDNEGLDRRLRADVVYRDQGSGAARLRYRSGAGVYSEMPLPLAGTGEWKKISLTLEDLAFADAASGYADLSLVAMESEPLVVRSLSLASFMNPAVSRVKGASRGKLIFPLEVTDPADEAYSSVVVLGGWEGRKSLRSGGKSRYLYFDASDALVADAVRNITIRVTYWDQGTGKLVLEYESATGETYRRHPSMPSKSGQARWTTASFVIDDARFGTKQSGNRADFRLRCDDDDGLTVRLIELTALGSRDEPRLTLEPSTGGGASSLRFEGTPAVDYRFEYSTDLISWNAFAFRAGSGGVQDLPLPKGIDSSPRRFFRVVY